MTKIQLKVIDIDLPGIKSGETNGRVWSLCPVFWADRTGKILKLSTFDTVHLNRWYQGTIKKATSPTQEDTFSIYCEVDINGEQILEFSPDNPFDDHTHQRLYYTTSDIVSQMLTTKDKSINIQSAMKSASRLYQGTGKLEDALIAFDKILAIIDDKLHKDKTHE